jgi:hypothetical protein
MSTTARTPESLEKPLEKGMLTTARAGTPEI